MELIKLLPLQGVEIEHIGLLALGSSKEAVHKLLGKPSEHNDHSWFYMKHEFRIDFDDEGNIEFIEFVFGPFPEKTTLSLYGHNPFSLLAADLVTLLNEHNQGDVDDGDAPYCYTFKNLAMGIWREFTAEDVEAGIADLDEGDEPDAENAEWLAQDLAMAQHFWTIGLGMAGYY